MIEMKGHRLLKCQGCGLTRTEYLKPIVEAPSANLYCGQYYIREGKKPLPPAKRTYQQWPRVKYLRKHRQGGNGYRDARDERIAGMRCVLGMFCVLVRVEWRVV